MASETSLRNPRKKRKQRIPNKPQQKHKSSKKRKLNVIENHQSKNVGESNVPEALPVDPFSFFVDEFQTANDVHLSSLELESMKDKCILGSPQSSVQDDKSLGQHIKQAFGTSWKEVLCEKKLLEGKIEPGCPAVLIISTSALRSIELLKGFRSLTQECHAVKLFSKHMKIEEQIPCIVSQYCNLGNEDNEMSNRGRNYADRYCLHVALLKNRVNIASGTPSRIKKLIDIEALGLSRLAVIVLDIHPDVKGYSLLSLPQVRDELWDLYKSYFHQRLVDGETRICLFGPLLSRKRRKKEVKSTV